MERSTPRRAVGRAKVVTEHHAEAYMILIVSKFQDAQAVHRMNPNLMREVIIFNLKKAEAFDALGVPWGNVVAFVVHQPLTEKAVYEYIHRRGARCIVGTSRNLDKRFLDRDVDDLQQLESGYCVFLNRGANLIETDIPVELGRLLYRDQEIPPALTKFLSQP